MGRNRTLLQRGYGWGVMGEGLRVWRRGYRCMGGVIHVGEGL